MTEQEEVHVCLHLYEGDTLPPRLPAARAGDGYGNGGNISGTVLEPGAMEMHDAEESRRTGSGGLPVHCTCAHCLCSVVLLAEHCPCVGICELQYQPACNGAKHVTHIMCIHRSMFDCFCLSSVYMQIKQSKDRIIGLKAQILKNDERMFKLLAMATQGR